jgi:hypothetical protein
VASLAAASFAMLAFFFAYKPPMARVVAAAQILSKPAAVRFNFSSDPAGATVESAAGEELGVTPLSIEAPYGDKAIEYVFHKPGFVPKIVALVPSLPSPIFVALEPEAPPAEPHKARVPHRVTGPGAAKAHARAKDPDAVLAPTFK